MQINLLKWGCGCISNMVVQALAAVPHLEGCLGANRSGNLPLMSALLSICFIFIILQEVLKHTKTTK